MHEQLDGETTAVAGRFTNLIDAEVARTVLEAARIPCVLRDEGLVGVAPHLSNAIGGVSLHVPLEDLVEARRLLEAREPARIQVDPLRPEEADLEREEEPSQAPSPRDGQATRAFRSAVLALFLAPVLLNVYSVYLLLTLRNLRGPLSARGRRHVALAVVFNLLVGWIPLAVFLSR